jgi:hypothetical protein
MSVSGSVRFFNEFVFISYCIHASDQDVLGVVLCHYYHYEIAKKIQGNNLSTNDYSCCLYDY